MKQKILDGLFVGVALLAMLAGLGRTVLAPKDVNEYENRYAARWPAFSAAGFLDGSFQDGVDAALGDQTPFAEAYKQVYNAASSEYLRASTEAVVPEDYGHYVNLDGTLLYGDYLVYSMMGLPWFLDALDARAANINAYIAAHPEVDFYVYYIEKDSDVDFETGDKTVARESLYLRLELPEEREGAFVVDDFEEYAPNFYRTDHHWNADGSYKGYLELLELLGVGEVPLERGERVAVGTMRGSKATGAAAAFSETFYAYRYGFPEMEITVNGERAADYGAQAALLDAPGGRVTYSAFYGGDAGEAVFSTGTEGRGKLLVVGESFDNAILKLLASHFDTLYAVDLRYYEHYMGGAFDFGEYVAGRGIEKVLLVGNVDYFRSSDFDLTGG